jgi:hypothetical protein
MLATLGLVIIDGFGMPNGDDFRRRSILAATST